MTRVARITDLEIAPEDLRPRDLSAFRKRMRSMAPEPTPPAPKKEASQHVQHDEHVAAWLIEKFRIVSVPPAVMASSTIVGRIKRATADHYKVPRTDIDSVRRDAISARARQVAMWLVRQMTPLSMPAIGRRFGGRDHTTVLHSIGKIDRLSKYDQKLAEDLRSIRALVDGDEK